MSSAYTIHSKSTLRLQNLLNNWKYSTVTISMVWLLRGLNRHFYNDERWSETNFCREFSSQHTIKVLPSAYFSSIETFRIEYLHMSLTPITSKRWSQKRGMKDRKKPVFMKNVCLKPQSWPQNLCPGFEFVTTTNSFQSFWPLLVANEVKFLLP